MRTWPSLRPDTVFPAGGLHPRWTNSTLAADMKMLSLISLFISDSTWLGWCFALQCPRPQTSQYRSCCCNLSKVSSSREISQIAIFCSQAAHCRPSHCTQSLSVPASLASGLVVFGSKFRNLMFRRTLMASFLQVSKAYT